MTVSYNKPQVQMFLIRTNSSVSRERYVFIQCSIQEFCKYS